MTDTVSVRYVQEQHCQAGNVRRVNVSALYYLATVDEFVGGRAAEETAEGGVAFRVPRLERLGATTPKPHHTRFP
jgi:hypothetical protein